MKEKMLWAYLKAYVDRLIAQNGDHHFSDNDVLKRTCSAVVFSGLSKGALYVTSCSETLKNKGIVRDVQSLIIDIACFPQLLEADAVLWITDADLIVVRSAESGYQAYTTTCPNWKDHHELCNSKELRCPTSSEFLFDISESINKEEGSHLVSHPVLQQGSTLVITLTSNHQA
ncbi:MAG: hypothetical protein HGB19_00705 [Chlorobiales bacterium]|jgi:hypothetical protein|nr:hypothetical protein [Chlorobiales bacterium]